MAQFDNGWTTQAFMTELKYMPGLQRTCCSSKMLVIDSFGSLSTAFESPSTRLAALRTFPKAKAARKPSKLALSGSSTTVAFPLSVVFFPPRTTSGFIDTSSSALSRGTAFVPRGMPKRHFTKALGVVG